MHEEENLALIRRLKSQDKTVVGDLYDKYGSTLYGIVLKIVRTETIAKDVLQESFLKIWIYGERFDESRGNLFTWMLNIARNTAIDKTRSAGFRKSRKRQLIDGEMAEKAAWSTQQNTDHIGLRKMVDDLEEKYRVVIDLVYFQGFTQREVKEYLGIPLGTVKSRIRIALRELRRLFGEHQVFIILILLAMVATG